MSEIIYIASDDRGLMGTTNCSNLGIKLGDGKTLSSAICSNGGKISGRFSVKEQDLIEELFVKHDMSSRLKPLFPVSFWQNSDAIQDFRLGDGGCK